MDFDRNTLNSFRQRDRERVREERENRTEAVSNNEEKFNFSIILAGFN